MGEKLERLGVLHQHARLRSAADAGDEGDGRGQAERAGAGDDEHGHGIHEGVNQARLGSEPEPQPERHHCDAGDCRHEPGGHPVRQPLDWCFAFLRLFDEADDLGQQRVTADALGVHHETAGRVKRAAGNGIAGSLGHRTRFAGQHRFIDVAGALGHAPIHRNLLSGAHPQKITGNNVGERHVLLAALADPMGALRRKAHEIADGGIGAGMSALLQNLADQNDGGDHGGGFEIERHTMGSAQRGGKAIAEQDGHRTVTIGCASAGDRQREHVGIAVPQRDPPPTDKGRAAPEEHRGGQRKLQPAGQPRVQAVPP